MDFSAQMAARAPVFASHAPVAPAAPAGTFAPGTKILVGSHKVVIQKYLAEGGFAHVYLVKMPEPKNGTDIAVLKRVAVPDKEQLANMRTEVETMKKLKGHRAIVTYYDSHASQLQGGGYEVFLLMEFCNGGGLIDFMNTRLQNRLTEPEIAKIFSDVAEGVACMHYLNPPLLHRDLKVENVLINESASGKRYKVCDFGSAAHPRKAGKTAEECRQILDDVMRHTTQQYRSPEMVDPHLGQDIDEKSDIWALGVFLYKLCYFTTPFEEQGQLAILNASFKYPAHPAYSDRMKKLIASMLEVDPRRRPNVYQVLTEACNMQGIKVPIKDIYSDPGARRAQTVASPPVIANSPPVVGAVFSPPKQESPVIPEITRMARGRPQTASRTPAPLSHKPSPSPMRIVSTDPFAALDSKTAAQHEDASNRFPSLDQFSLLHEQGSKFEFSSSSPTANAAPTNDLSKRVTERLADDFFATAGPKPPAPSASPFSPAGGSMSRAQRIISGTPELQATISQQPTQTACPPSPVKPYKPSTYISHGTMTSPDVTAPDAQAQRQQYVPPPIHRFPPADDHHRSISLSRGLGASTTPDRSLLTESPRPVSVSRNRSFQISSSAAKEQSPRSSLDSRRPSPLPQARPEMRQRPSSAYLETQKQSKPGFFSKALPKQKASQDNVVPAMYSDEISRTPSPASSDSPIDSNVEFLRQMEESDKKDSSHKRNSSIHKHVKRASLPIRFAEKFGETFKRFETNSGGHGRTPSPLQDDSRQLGLMTPIAGSEAADDRSDGRRSAELHPNLMTGEQRREQERKALEDEERRVEMAAREYKSRLAEREAAGTNVMPPPRSIGGVSKASSIQNKVKSLLDENERPAQVTRTAQGYGKYTDGVGEQARAFESDRSDSEREKGASMQLNSGRPMFVKPPAPLASRKPIVVAQQQYPPPQQQYPPPQQQYPPPQQQLQQNSGRPRAPPGAKPKPVHLTGGGGGLAPSNPYANASPKSSSNALSSSPPKQSMQPGTPAAPAPRPSVGGPDMAGPRDGWTAKEKEDYLHTFKKRYPSLSGLEMVETTIGGGDDRRPQTGRARRSGEVSRVV